MKRSRRVKLVLLTGISAGALGGCDPSNSSPQGVNTQSVYTNNFHIPGAGYYHAPFRAWYALPYNYFDPKTQRYYYGGQWGTSPHQTITNISSPTAEAINRLPLPPSTYTGISRGGFGGSSRSGFVSS